MALLAISMGYGEKDSGNHHDLGNLENTFDWPVEKVPQDDICEGNTNHDKKKCDAQYIGPAVKYADLIKDADNFVQFMHFFFCPVSPAKLVATNWSAIPLLHGQRQYYTAPQ
jgi:hypothetical protein